MRKLTASLKYQHIAKVSAISRLGILDNMRYDRASPFEEIDANILEGFLTTAGSGPCTFLICCWSETKRVPWTMERWNTSYLTLVPLGDGEEYGVERRI